MVKKPGKWLAATLNTIHRYSKNKSVFFTHKAAMEVGSLTLGLDFDDVCDVLCALKLSDFSGRLASRLTGEWLYVFKPEVGGMILYIKLLLRNDCVVVSFHEDEDES